MVSFDMLVFEIDCELTSYKVTQCIWDGEKVSDKVVLSISCQFDDTTQLKETLQTNKVVVSECKVVVVYPSFFSNKMKVQMCVILYDDLGANETYFINSAVLALYSSGHTTGCSVEILDKMSYVSSIYEGFALPHAIDTMDVGNNDLTDTIFQSIMKCDVDIRRDLFANVVLSSTEKVVTGLDKRIQKELQDMAPPSMKVNVVKNVANYVFSGVGILASIANDDWLEAGTSNRWMTKTEYDELGSEVVLQKF